jgi:hypothetical protein
MAKHVLAFDGMKAAGITPRHGPFLRELLDVLGDGCLQATRLRVDGRSTALGATPKWLESASSFELGDIEPDAIVLKSPPLHTFLEQLQVSHMFSDFDRGRSCLDLFEDSLEDALSGREESDRYDRNLMETIEGLGRLFRYGIKRISVINGGRLDVDSRAIELIRSLRTRMPEDRKVKMPGVLEVVEPSHRTFFLHVRSDTDQRLWGIASPSALREASLTEVSGMQVIVEGIAKFRPSGTVLRIEAERIEQVPVADLEQRKLHDELLVMVQEGRVDEARDRIKAELEAGRGQALRVWAKLLNPPSSAPQPRSGRDDFDDNAAWLRRHTDHYRGKWVALSGGSLLDQDSSLIKLRDRLREKGLEREAFCVKVEA